MHEKRKACLTHSMYEYIHGSHIDTSISAFFFRLYACLLGRYVCAEITVSQGDCVGVGVGGWRPLVFCCVPFCPFVLCCSCDFSGTREESGVGRGCVVCGCGCVGVVVSVCTVRTDILCIAKEILSLFFICTTNVMWTRRRQSLHACHCQHKYSDISCGPKEETTCFMFTVTTKTEVCVCVFLPVGQSVSQCVSVCMVWYCVCVFWMVLCGGVG